MKTLHKIFITTILGCLILFSCLFSACQKEPFLYPYLSEFYSNVYFAEKDDLKLKASYGFKEKIRENDGKVSEKIFLLTFVLIDDKTETSNYSISFDLNGNTYSQTFSISPISGKTTAQVEIEESEFSSLQTTISYGSTRVDLVLNSALPKTYISGFDALRILEQKQGELINSYKDQNGEFFAEVTMRLLIKDDKPYWHVAFIKGKRSVKALLIDGLSGEILAVRNIY